MMLDILEAIIIGIWSLMTIQISIDGIPIQIWHIFAFAALLAITINGIFGKKGTQE